MSNARVTEGWVSSRGKLNYSQSYFTALPLRSLVQSVHLACSLLLTQGSFFSSFFLIIACNHVCNMTNLSNFDLGNGRQVNTEWHRTWIMNHCAHEMMPLLTCGHIIPVNLKEIPQVTCSSLKPLWRFVLFEQISPGMCRFKYDSAFTCLHAHLAFSGLFQSWYVHSVILLYRLCVKLCVGKQKDVTLQFDMEQKTVQ